jgi:hypothetical protein
MTRGGQQQKELVMDFRHLPSSFQTIAAQLLADKIRDNDHLVTKEPVTEIALEVRKAFIALCDGADSEADKGEEEVTMPKLDIQGGMVTAKSVRDLLMAIHWSPTPEKTAWGCAIFLERETGLPR